MIGLLVLALFATYLYLSSSLARMLGNRLGLRQSGWQHWAVLALILALPFGDEIIGRAQFANECRKAEHYSISPSLQTAQQAIEDQRQTVTRRLNAAIPIKKITVTVVDPETGSRLLSYAALFTEGGWIMRAGLNLGGFSSCHPEGGAIQLMRKHGFTLTDGGIYRRTAAP